METYKRRIPGLSHHIHFIFVAICLCLILPAIAGATCTTINWGSSNNWVIVDKDKANNTIGASISSSNLTLNAYGKDVWEESTGSSGSKLDQYYAYYRDNVAGSWTAVVKVISQTTTSTYNCGGGGGGGGQGPPPQCPYTITDWAKSGIMVKNDISVSGEDNIGSDTTPKNGYCIVAMTPPVYPNYIHGVTFQWDSGGTSGANGYLDSHIEISNSTYPVWLKLVKEPATTGTGYTFSAYYSTDNSNWTQVGSATTLATAGSTQDVGVFVSAHDKDINNNTVFSDFCFETGTSYTIAATSGYNGTITSGGATVAANSSSNFTVSSGYNETFTINPDTGYAISKVSVDDTDVTSSISGSSYTFTNVTANHTIKAEFVITTKTITATAGSNGSISPASASVNYNDTQTFDIKPDSGYKLNTLLVDGLTMPLTGYTSGDTSYTFNNVVAAHTIAVTFAQTTHSMTVSAGTGGTFLPGSATVNDGESVTYTATITSGYYVDTFTDNGVGVALDSNNQYAVSNITTDHVINISFTQTPTIVENIAGCAQTTSANYSSGFSASNFDLSNVSVSDGHIVLSTGASAIDPNSIVIPFKQEVAVSFLYEGAGYESDLGYILASDAVFDSTGKLNWSGIDKSKKHMIFHNVHDENDDGILDTAYGNGSFPTSSETSLAAYNDGTTTYPGIKFVPNMDGSVTTKDMRKVIGTFEAGTELVFFLTANQDWDTSSSTGVFFTKKTWNPDTYTACTPSTGASYTDCAGATATNFQTTKPFYKKYELGTAMSEGSCSLDKGWLPEAAITRMSTNYGITLAGTANLCITYNAQYPHVIVGAPASDPNQWILGWEDLTGAGDSDHNDMAFRIERKTGGVAQLLSNNAVTPKNSDGTENTGAYYTAVTFSTYDYMPGSGKTKITYYLSINNGTNWTEITNWDKVYASSASKSKDALLTNWSPGLAGSPQTAYPYTYREVRIDFAALGICGRQFLWKAQLESEDETYSPAILDVGISGNVATNGTISRAAPVVQTNVIYTGSYETPAIDWADKTLLRGHFTANRLYDPVDPTKTSTIKIWDAGEVLNSIASPESRVIYFPSGTLYAVSGEVIGTGNGTQKTFTGTLAHHPIVAETISITDTHETFSDRHTDELTGTYGGTGTIDRFTGEYSITFNTAPGNHVPITATIYYYYITSSTMIRFEQANVTSNMLGLDNRYVTGKGFTYDFNNDGKFNGVAYGATGTYDETDADWLVEWVRGWKDGSLKTTKKEWLLGAIDHSVPAVETPPGVPKWYFGSDITEDERTTYNAFKNTWKARKTVVYVGARDAMLHAFNGGAFRWGDNAQTTAITENRGYFKWTNETVTNDSSTADYGTGSELWSFIPANLIARLKNNYFQSDDQSYVDASPTIADVYINGAWKTILVCAEGNGGDTVFCLDVTDPDHPSFLWEYADPDLFRSRSSPTVGLGRMVVGGHPTWVAMFVSGITYNTALFPSLYIVNIEDGSIVKRVELRYNDGTGQGGVPSGQPAIVDSDGNGYIDRVYIGTDKGFLYKINVPDDPKSSFNTISYCIINNTDFTDENGNTIPSDQRYHPIYASPAIVVDNKITDTGDIDYNIKIFFGTGDSPYYNENINTGNTTYHFFAYNDKDAKGVCGNKVRLEWFVALPAGQRVWASAFASAGQIYFGTSTAETENPCDATSTDTNNGQLFVYTTEGTLKKTFNTGNVVTSPLVEDEHLYFRTTDGLKFIGGDNYNTKTRLSGTGKTTVESWKEVDE